MPNKVVIWGAGGHAKVVADILTLQGGCEIAGFLDDTAPQRQGESFCSSTILGGRECLHELHVKGVHHAILAFGDCQARLRLMSVLNESRYELATAIHPAATVARDAVIGAGSMIVAGAVINPGSKIGRGVIINTLASVDHDCTIEDAAHICPGVRLAGNVTIGQAAWIGIGATVIQNVKIGAEAVIGAGAVVLHDVPPNAVAYGVPAKVHRIQPNEKP